MEYNYKSINQNFNILLNNLYYKDVALRQIIRNADVNCVICKISFNKNGRDLDVHEIDNYEDPVKFVSYYNRISLCTSCHRMVDKKLGSGSKKFDRTVKKAKPLFYYNILLRDSKFEAAYSKRLQEVQLFVEDIRENVLPNIRKFVYESCDLKKEINKYLI